MDTVTKLASGACPVMATDVFTATEQTSVVAIDISNPTVNVQEVIVMLDGDELFNVEMPPKGGVSWHGPQLLNIGEKINITCDSASCKYHITGVATV